LVRSTGEPRLSGRTQADVAVRTSENFETAIYFHCSGRELYPH
jgi:hypothetical protein